MRPNPNFSTNYLFSENDAETNIDNGSEDTKSKSELSVVERLSPPRMQSAEIHDMEVDGGSEQEQVINELLRNRKRARSENGTAGGEQENLSSTEPINKKQRIYEPDVSSSNSSSASSSSSASTTSICEKNNRVKHLEKFTFKECDELKLIDQKNYDRVLTLLLGENPADWPNIDLHIRKILRVSDALKLLLSECGAGYLCECKTISDTELFGFKEWFVVASNFDLDRFRIGLLEHQRKQQAQTDDLANDNHSEGYATPLMLAVQWGDLKALQLLLSEGESTRPTNNNIGYALLNAVNECHIELVQLLLKHINDSDQSIAFKLSALKIATSKGYMNVCELLIKHGAPLNIPDVNMPLHIATEMGRTDICKLFIKYGADIDQKDLYGNPPLYKAIRYKNVDTLKLLLSSGADINSTDYLRESLFGFVFSSQNIELINCLLERSDNVNASPSEYTPLMRAASTGNPEIVKIFLAKGAEINSVTDKGDTALSQACRSGSLDTVKLLLNNGADPNGDQRKSPLVNAAKYGCPSIIQLLIEYGAILFSDDNVGYRALRGAVKYHRFHNLSKLLELNVPVEHAVIDQKECSLLMLLMSNFGPVETEGMLELLLKNKLPLQGADDDGNDALMSAVNLLNFNAAKLLMKYGATVALKQTNKKGKNVLEMAIERLDWNPNSPRVKHNILLLASLLNSVKNNPDWPALQSTIINTAETTLTREVISTSLVWPLTKKDTSIIDVVKTTIDFSALEKLIKSIVRGTIHLRQDIERELSVVGIYSALSKEIYPYLEALPHIQFSLFGNVDHVQNKTISSFIAGLGATLENICIEHSVQWNPYKIDFEDNTIFTPLNQIANTQLTQLIDTSIATETTDLEPVFGTLSEICFNASFTAHKLPATFPPYQAAPGALKNALLARGVYAAFASKIEIVWKKVWEKFTGTPLSSDSIHSNSSSRSSSSSSSTRTSSSTSLATVIDGDDMDDFFSSEDLPREWIDELPAPPNPASFLESAQVQALFQEFRDELRLAFDQVGSNILDLPKSATEMPADAAKVYLELMFRQLHMLKQFIEAE